MRFVDLRVIALVLLAACSASHKVSDDLAMPVDLERPDLFGTVPEDLFGADASIVTTGANVVPLVVDGGPTGKIINTPFISITLCAPGSTTSCQTIDHIMVDT